MWLSLPNSSNCQIKKPCQSFLLYSINKVLIEAVQARNNFKVHNSIILYNNNIIVHKLTLNLREPTTVSVTHL